jgi:hypothetical protein
MLAMPNPNDMSIQTLTTNLKMLPNVDTSKYFGAASAVNK